MATHTLVEPLNNSLAALIGLSLKSHGVPVTAEFWLHSAETGQTKLAIVTPLVDKKGVRETYLRFFNALEGETFSTQLRLRTILFAIGEQEAAPALKALKSGPQRLSGLGPYEDVDIFPVPDASEIARSGFLHFTPVDVQPLSYLASFGAFGESGAMKTRIVPSLNLDGFLDEVQANENQRAEVVKSLRQLRSASVILNNIDLATLYKSGLI